MKGNGRAELQRSDRVGFRIAGAAPAPARTGFTETSHHEVLGLPKFLVPSAVHSTGHACLCCGPGRQSQEVRGLPEGPRSVALRCGLWRQCSRGGFGCGNFSEECKDWTMTPDYAARVQGSCADFGRISPYVRSAKIALAKGEWHMAPAGRQASCLSIQINPSGAQA